MVKAILVKVTSLIWRFYIVSFLIEELQSILCLRLTFMIIQRLRFVMPDYPCNVAISIRESSLISEPIFSIEYNNRSERIFLSDLLRANISRGILYVYTSQLVKLNYAGRFAFVAHIGRRGKFSPSTFNALHITLFTSQFCFRLFDSGSMQKFKILFHDIEVKVAAYKCKLASNREVTRSLQ